MLPMFLEKHVTDEVEPNMGEWNYYSTAVVARRGDGSGKSLWPHLALVLAVRKPWLKERLRRLCRNLWWVK
jgi:hypothetical protein